MEQVNDSVFTDKIRQAEKVLNDVNVPFLSLVKCSREKVALYRIENYWKEFVKEVGSGAEPDLGFTTVTDPSSGGGALPP